MGCIARSTLYLLGTCPTLQLIYVDDVNWTAEIQPLLAGHLSMASTDLCQRHQLDSLWPSDLRALLLGIFWLAFATRPLGAVVFGYVGDRYGRLPVLLITIGLMWFATLGIAMLPGYESIGMAAPILLTLLRMLQGFSLGGEGGGGMTYALECTAPANRGRVGAQWQVAGSLGNVFANLFAGVLRASLSPEALASWGWRPPRPPARCGRPQRSPPQSQKRRPKARPAPTRPA